MVILTNGGKVASLVNASEGCLGKKKTTPLRLNSSKKKKTDMTEKRLVQRGPFRNPFLSVDLRYSMATSNEEALKNVVETRASSDKPAVASTLSGWGKSFVNFFRGNPKLTATGVALAGGATLGALAPGAVQAIADNSVHLAKVVNTIGPTAAAAGAAGVAVAGSAALLQKVLGPSDKSKIVTELQDTVAKATAEAEVAMVANAEVARAAQSASGRNLTNLPAVAAAGASAMASVEELSAEIANLKSQLSKFAQTGKIGDAIIAADTAAIVKDTLASAVDATARASKEIETAAEQILEGGELYDEFDDQNGYYDDGGMYYDDGYGGSPSRRRYREGDTIMKSPSSASKKRSPRSITKRPRKKRNGGTTRSTIAATSTPRRATPKRRQPSPRSTSVSPNKRSPSRRGTSTPRRRRSPNASPQSITSFLKSGRSRTAY